MFDFEVLLSSLGEWYIIVCMHMSRANRAAVASLKVH